MQLAEVGKIDKIEHGALIKFLIKEGKNVKEIYDRLVAVYNEATPSYATVNHWHKESLEDEPRLGRPSEATLEDTVDHVEAMIMKNRLLKRRTRPMQNPARFESRIVMGDEAWIQHWDPETKFESMTWNHKGFPTPLKFRNQSSAGKIMASIIWDAKGVLLVDFLPRGSTITGEYNAGVLGRLRDSIRQKRWGKSTRGVLLHDNAPVHKARHVQVALRDCGFEQFNHPPCSQDLDPSDYFLFCQLKSSFRKQRFHDDNEVKETVTMWMEKQLESFWLPGMYQLNYGMSIGGD
ncbi:hypothetical protein O3P69_011193 [Scylla paramamosain]|uniref:Mos1 transposase HTH domain-containing protein n=1 Tax=Scylla paramamosain TaxID=85552 RepID=A0AAW0SUD3_SCYPA